MEDTRTPEEIAEVTAREVLAIHYFLGRLGFDYGDIYVAHGIDKEGKIGVAVKLEAQGLTMIFGAGPTGVDPDDFQPYWENILQKHNKEEFTDTEQTALFDKSGIGNNLITALAAMKERGFELDMPEEMQESIAQIHELSKIMESLG